MGRLVTGVNDLQTVNPTLAAKWHPTLNHPRTASDIAKSSPEKVWWIDACGHEWDASVTNMTTGTGACPFCNTVGRKRVMPGQNDLETLRPDVASEWHPANPKSASEVTAGSKYRARWLCASGHEWQATVNNRTSASRTGCPQCSGRRPTTARNLAVTFPGLMAEWADTNVVDPNDLTPVSGHRADWVCLEGHQWTCRVAERTNAGTGCPTCAYSRTSGPSAPELELLEYVKSLGVLARSDRTVLSGRELDVLVPEHGIAFEFNGLYWHSDEFKTPTYHRNKSRDALAQGVRLIHIWEDEWKYKRGIVERMIARKLGLSSEPRLNARSLTLTRVALADARTFLEENHIQGFASGSAYLGLADDSGVHALMVLKKRTDAEWELVRFATSAIVRGGHSRLFKWFLQMHPGVSRVVTFADNDVSDGGLYETCGFVRERELAPDYRYVVGDKRVHKFNYRKARFRDDPELLFEDGLTERELADLNGLKRIWDGGKALYAYNRNAETPSEEGETGELTNH